MRTPSELLATNGRRALLAALLLASTGCAWLRSFPRPGVDPSTISRDRASIPRGEVIPPAGFGVDLVKGKDGQTDGQILKTEKFDTDPPAGMIGGR